MTKFESNICSPTCLAFIFLVCLSVQVPAQTFVEVSSEIGLPELNTAAHAGWGDYNNDGWVDLAVGGQLYRNDQGTFVETRFSDDFGHDKANGRSSIWLDYDNDGDLDLHGVTLDSYAFRLFENTGADDIFKDASDRLPADRMTGRSVNATLGDFNNDGHIDMYVPGGSDKDGHEGEHDELWMNNGNGTFAVAWKTPDSHLSRGAAACDFDEDGDQDIYVGNYRLLRNYLWINDGRSEFEDLAETYGVAGDGGQGAWGHTIGVAWADLDNDGHFDLVAVNLAHPAAYQDRTKFYRNTGPNGAWLFDDKSDSVGLVYRESAATITLGDYDNDSDLDFFLATCYSDTSVLYRNDGNWTFTDVTAAAGFDKPADIDLNHTHQATWTDYDNDGDLDLLTSGKLFRNKGNDNRWLKVRLSGEHGVNRAAVGTQVRLSLNGKTLSRQVEGSTGDANQNDMTLHFGLGAHEGPVVLDITWPNGARQEVQTETNRVVNVRSSAAPKVTKTPAPTPDPGLVGHWQFDATNGMLVKDRSGNSRHGHILNGGRATKRVAGVSGAAIKFEGLPPEQRDAAGCVAVPGLRKYDFTKGLTIQMWVKFDQCGEDQFFELANTAETGRGPGWRFGCYPANRFMLFSGAGYNTEQEGEVQAAKQFEPGVWYHLAGTYDGSVYRAYLDGKELAVSKPGQFMSNGRDSMYLGSFGGDVYSMDGIMDEVKLYSRARDAEEIRQDAVVQPASAKQFTMPVVKSGRAMLDNLASPAWEQAAPIDDFVTMDGSKAEVSTEVRVVRDEDWLYVRFVCHEPLIQKLVVTDAGRDGALWVEDCAELFIDPSNGKTWFYHWIVNAKGQIWDGLHSPAGTDAGYDSKAVAKSVVLEDRWVCALAIPLNAIGGPQPGDVLGLNFARERRAGGDLQLSAWSMNDQGFHDPLLYGSAQFAAPWLRIDSRGAVCTDVKDKGLNAFTLSLATARDLPTKLQAEVRMDGTLVAGREVGVAAGETRKLVLPYTVPAEGQPTFEFKVAIDGVVSYQSRLQAVKPIPEKAKFRSWIVPDPLYEELLSDEPPGLRSQGSLVWAHLLDLPMGRPAAVRFATRYVSDDMHRDHSLSGFRLVSSEPGRADDPEAVRRWNLTDVPEGPLPRPPPGEPWPWPLDPDALDLYFTSIESYLVSDAADNMWGIYSGDEHDDGCVHNAARLMRNPEGYTYIHEVDKLVRETYGGGRWGLPKGNRNHDPNPYKWIALYRWTNAGLRDRQRRLSELIQEKAPRLVVVSVDPSGGLYPSEYSLMAPYADVFTHQVGYPDGSHRWRAGVGGLSKIMTDLTGKEFWPCAHIERYNYPDAKPAEVLEEFSQVFRNGGTGLHLFLPDISGGGQLVGDTRTTWFGSPRRYHTIMAATRFIRTMPKLKMPDYERTAVLYNDDTLGARPHDGPMTTPETILACYTMLGPVARSWFKFIDCPQVLSIPSLNDRFDTIYLPVARYQRPPIVERLRNFVEAGGTLICGDPAAFETDHLGNPTTAARKEIFGVTVGDRLEDAELRTLDPASDATLPLESNAFRLAPDAGTEVLIAYSDGSPAVTSHTVGRGRAILFGANPFVAEHVPNEGWRDFFTAWVKAMGAPTGLDIWRFKLPDHLIWQEPEQLGVCLTNNRVLWQEEQPSYPQNFDVHGTYTCSLAPDAMPDTGNAEVTFADGRLTDRRKSIFAEKRRPTNYEEYAEPDSTWMISWGATETVSITFDLQAARKLLELKLWFRDTLPAVTVEGSTDGRQWRKLGQAEGVAAGADIHDLLIGLPGRQANRYLRANFAARQPGEKLSLIEAEVWAE